MQEVINRYVDYLRAERNASPHTIRTYYNSLVGNNTRGTQKGFFPFLVMKKINSLDNVNRQTIRDYIIWLMEQGVAKTSITCKLSAIRSFYLYLQKEGLIVDNPVGEISLPKLDKRLPFCVPRLFPGGIL